MIKRVVLTAIKLFQKTRALRQPSCRFYPSCSDYSYGCIEKHGLGKGVLLSCWRVLRCQPLHPGGIDDIPEQVAWVPRVFLYPSRRICERAAPTHSSLRICPSSSKLD